MSKPVPIAKLAETVDCGPWKITVTGVRLLSELDKDGPRPVLLKDKASHWLVIVVTLENVTNAPRELLSRVVKLPGREIADGIVLVRDVTVAGPLNPGMPESLAYFWEEPVGKVSTEQSVSLTKWTERENVLTGATEWLDEEPCAEANNIPVVDKRGSA